MLRGIGIILLALAASLSWGNPTWAHPDPGGLAPGGSHLRTFSAGGISFSYPATWHAYQFPWGSSFSTSLAYVSNMPLHRPCVGRPISPGCQGPVSALRADSTLLIWTENGFPGWTFQRAHGALLHVDGRSARIQVLAPQRAWCPGNSTEMLGVVIARPEAPDNWYEFRACLAGPHLGRLRAVVMRILSSFHATRHVLL